MLSVFRIGAGAGYSGDRIDPALDLARRGQLNALVFECLAERTIALAQQRRLKDPEQGYDPLLLPRMRAVLPECLAQGVTVLTNMGAAHPLAAGQQVIQLVQTLAAATPAPNWQRPVRVAVVQGDDVLDWVRAHNPSLLDADGLTHARDLGERLISANAYLGADALLPALQAEAAVIITGRVADPSLFLAPLLHHFGWGEDDWPMLGRGLAVGHLLECAAQVSGGYLADPGRVDVPDLHRVGFPLAEVHADGCAVITKLPGTGGRVDRLSCTAQLLYELEDPAQYLQADVTADFSQISFTQIDPDRVLVQGASGRPRPEQLKVSLGYTDGYIGEGQISYAGPGARLRGELALQILRQRLADTSLLPTLAGLEHRAELIGVDAMHGPDLGRASDPYEVRVRLAVRCPSRAQAERVGQEVEALYLNGPAAGGGVTQSVREVVAVASCLIPRDVVQTRCDILEWRP